MAANFWQSSHGNNWLFTARDLENAKAEDRKYASEQELGLILIWSANVLHKMAKKLSLRQQVTATAIVFFRRFYTKNSYAETDPCLVAATCLYVAAKAEEMPVHIKSIVGEARAIFADQGASSFTSDNHKLAETEFYLLEDLEFHLIVHHPYKALAQMCGRDQAKRDGTLEIKGDTLDMAWYIINDTYRTELCLLHPPHLIAIAALFLAFSLYPPGPPAKQQPSAPAPTPKPSPAKPAVVDTPPRTHTPQPSSLHPSLPQRPSTIMVAPPPSRSQSFSVPSPQPSAPSTPTSTSPAVGKLDPLTFLSRLNVSVPLVLGIVQQITSLYPLWNTYETQSQSQAASQFVITGGTPGRSPMPGSSGAGADEKMIKLLQRMRTERMGDIAHPASGKPASNIPAYMRR